MSQLADIGSMLREAISRDLKQRSGELAYRYVMDLKEDLATPFPPASQPGEFPHRRTGNLMEGIRGSVEIRGDEVVATISSERDGDDPKVPLYLEDSGRPFISRQFDEVVKEQWIPDIAGL